jgi:hypothetical protein
MALAPVPKIVPSLKSANSLPILYTSVDLPYIPSPLASIKAFPASLNY